MRKSTKSAMMYILPALLFYTVFMIIPLVSSLRYSLFEWRGIGEMKFVGLRNYIDLFTRNPYKERFWNALGNNILFFIYTMIFQNAVALFLAVLLSQKLKGTTVFRFIFFLPTTLSIIIVGYLWLLILNPTWGPLNAALKAMGLSSLALPWLGNTKTSLLCIAIANAWQYAGIPMMMYASGINGIPDSVKEAALIDGCTPWKQFWHVTFPLLRGTIGMTTVTTFVRNFSAFEIVYAMAGTSAGPLYSTDIFGTFFYRTLYGDVGSNLQDYGMGAAIASCMLVFITVGVVVWLIWDRKSEN